MFSPSETLFYSLMGSEFILSRSTLGKSALKRSLLEGDFYISSVMRFRQFTLNHRGRPWRTSAGNTCFPTSDPLSTFVRMWLTPSPYRRPRLALDTAVWSDSVIAGAIKICCSLISSSQRAAQSKDKINRKFM